MLPDNTQDSETKGRFRSGHSTPGPAPGNFLTTAVTYATAVGMLTPVHAYALRIIAAYIRENGYAPTGVEVGAALGTTQQYANRLMRRLLKEGYLRSTGEKIRGIAVVKMIGGAS